MKGIWYQKCYEKVSWAEIDNETSLHRIRYLGDSTYESDNKLKRGTSSIKPPSVNLSLISPFFEIFSMGIDAFKETYFQYTAEEKRRIEEVYSEIFPVKRRFFIGAGERERNPTQEVTQKIHELYYSRPRKIKLNANSTIELNANDIETGHVIREIAHSFSLVRVKPKKVEAKDSKMDLSYNLILVGGPIPNAYTRNVLYGNIIKTPFKFRLDIGEYGSYSPLELKNIPHSKEPNWYICDEDGNETDGGVPEIKNGVLTKDSFMIIKCKNIYDKAHINRKSIIFAGCHGEGTWAAGALMKDEKHIQEIYSKAENNDFQLIGQVSIENIPKEQGIYKKINDIKIKDIKELKCWKCQQKIS